MPESLFTSGFSTHRTLHIFVQDLGPLKSPENPFYKRICGHWANPFMNNPG